MTEPPDDDVTEMDYEEVTGDPLGLFAVADSARRGALVEAYWKLRDHAEGLRGTEVYRRAKAAFDADKTKRGFVALSWRCLGLEAGARLIAELLGIEEHEIERPTAEPGRYRMSDDFSKMMLAALKAEGVRYRHHRARVRRGDTTEVARPLRDTSWWHRWRAERACRKTLGHCWHPEGLIGWWCCNCSGETDGMPEQRCKVCAEHEIERPTS